MAYPEPHYSITETAKDLPTYTAESTDKVLARQADGKLGYILVSDLQTTLDGDGLATDADIAALRSQIGVSGSYASQDKFYATNNGGGQNFKVGDDVWIGDINNSNVMQISGVQNSGSGFIKFGSGVGTPVLGYSGSNSHISLNSALALAPQATLGSAPVGSLAVSGSHLYFNNGAWVQVI